MVAIGLGYVAAAFARGLRAEGWRITGTSRSDEGLAGLRAQCDEAVRWPGETLSLGYGDALLISAPPGETGCPVFEAFGADAARARWIGYLSTTGVYGDLAGGWAFEETPLNPQSPEAERRAKAEAQWLDAGGHVFRLPGIYGPGRSALERATAPGARRIVKAGQVFSRAHRDDIAAALAASMARPNPGRVYNVCDDEPAGADMVLGFAAELLGVPAPPEVAFEDAALSPMAQRFYAECKRVSNARVKAELGWRPAFPTYREGLKACLSMMG
ncbi:SDR family NAD(P)-dependent oxidoreductase [bacterium]|nr:SDR family NAD(P)-dependent oxidoreductase [bacterium]